MAHNGLRGWHIFGWKLKKNESVGVLVKRHISTSIGDIRAFHPSSSSSLLHSHCIANDCFLCFAKRDSHVIKRLLCEKANRHRMSYCRSLALRISMTVLINSRLARLSTEARSARFVNGVRRAPAHVVRA